MVKKEKKSKDFNLRKKKDFIEYSHKAAEWIVNFNHNRPFEVLGPHYFAESEEVIINCFLPDAKKAVIIPDDIDKPVVEMELINKGGFYQTVLKNENDAFKYKIRAEYKGDKKNIFEDPYFFDIDITDFDLYLMGEGNHFKSYEKYGAKVKEINGVQGVQFMVWAPNCKSVSVVGNFNFWKTGIHQMENINNSGNWGLFIPGLKEGEVYKFALKSRHTIYS